MPAKKSTAAGEQIICVNRQARHNYFIDETYEAGLVLVGSEVKSLRDGKANLTDSYARVQKGEAFLFGAFPRTAVADAPAGEDNRLATGSPPIITTCSLFCTRLSCRSR